MIDPLAAIGLVAIGALLVVAILVGAVAWVCRGHRVDLTGVRVVSKFTGTIHFESPISPEPEDWKRWATLEEIKLRAEKKPDDYDLSREL